MGDNIYKTPIKWGQNHSNLKTIIFKLVKNMFKIIIDLSIYIYQIDINQLWTTGIQSIGPADTQVTSGIRLPIVIYIRGS